MENKFKKGDVIEFEEDDEEYYEPTRAELIEALRRIGGTVMIATGNIPEEFGDLFLNSDFDIGIYESDYSLLMSFLYKLKEE